MVQGSLAQDLAIFAHVLIHLFTLTLSVGGHQYPIKLLWTKETVLVESLHYYGISELDSAPLAKKLNLSAKDFNFANDSWLPDDFQWRGKYIVTLIQPHNNKPAQNLIWQVRTIIIIMLKSCSFFRGKFKYSTLQLHTMPTYSYPQPGQFTA